MPRPNRAWQVKDARAHFSALIERALAEGPQMVLRNGKEAVVVVSVEEWNRRKGRKGDLVEFFANSPLRDEKLEIERMRDAPREIDL